MTAPQPAPPAPDGRALLPGDPGDDPAPRAARPGGLLHLDRGLRLDLVAGDPRSSGSRTCLRAACRSPTTARAPPRVARTSPTASPTSASPRSPTRASIRSPGRRTAARGRTPTCRSSPAARPSPTTSRSAASRSRRCGCRARRIAKIFTNKITNWNDPAITDDNNGRALPVAADPPGRPLGRLGHDRPVHPLPGDDVPLDLGAVQRRQVRAHLVVPAPGRAGRGRPARTRS